MTIYGFGAAFASMGTGFMCDLIRIKSMGFAVVGLSSLVLSFLYLGLAVDNFYITAILFMFVGMSTFGLFTWLICACSKTFGGKL